MAAPFYPPPGSHRSAAIYPSTPIPGAFPAPQLQVPMIVPSRVNSRHSHHSHLSHRSHRSHHDDPDYEDDHDLDRGREYYHDRDRDHHRHRSQSRHRHHSDRDRRHHDRDDRKHRRSRRKHYSVPQVATVPQMYPGSVGLAQSQVGYPGTYPGTYPGSYPGSYPGQYYDYRPSWTQRLRQFFGFAPASPYYQYKSNTHSWGFLGRSKRPRYVDPRTGGEVDRYGRPVIRM